MVNYFCRFVFAVLMEDVMSFWIYSQSSKSEFANFPVFTINNSPFTTTSGFRVSRL